MSAEYGKLVGATINGFQMSLDGPRPHTCYMTLAINPGQDIPGVMIAKPGLPPGYGSTAERISEPENLSDLEVLPGVFQDVRRLKRRTPGLEEVYRQGKDSDSLIQPGESDITFIRDPQRERLNYALTLSSTVHLGTVGQTRRFYKSAPDSSHKVVKDALAEGSF